MVTISEGALALMAAIPVPKGQVLRLEPQRNRRLGLLFGRPEPGDQIAELDGRDVVHIAERLSVALDGATLGVRDGGESERFVVTPPRRG